MAAAAAMEARRRITATNHGRQDYSLNKNKKKFIEGTTVNLFALLQ
jgi:hypothetical protein